MQELTVPSFVANDTLVAGGSGNGYLEVTSSPVKHNGRDEESNLSKGCIDIPSLLILTGPNYSGKSVYLKQVCICVRLIFYVGLADRT